MKIMVVNSIVLCILETDLVHLVAEEVVNIVVFLIFQLLSQFVVEFSGLPCAFIIR